MKDIVMESDSLVWVNGKNGDRIGVYGYTDRGTTKVGLKRKSCGKIKTVSEYIPTPNTKIKHTLVNDDYTACFTLGDSYHLRNNLIQVKIV